MSKMLIRYRHNPYMQVFCLNRISQLTNYWRYRSPGHDSEINLLIISL